ncbi:hypothetical protein KUV80_05015 [Fictibacillus nanhaiensis]|uniref:hypothetical protein n=1 Tax=Fictibacillus nanhaiensis TaxID=742169 RepID=UPI001C954A43|nr:hypothetical protein [Fictibacillus nanhaiensis]MBY6035997.1 hypothetical protein [Fictibacillus nanhaiensis]
MNKITPIYSGMGVRKVATFVKIYKFFFNIRVLLINTQLKTDLETHLVGFVVVYASTITSAAFFQFIEPRIDGVIVRVI